MTDSVPTAVPFRKTLVVVLRKNLQPSSVLASLQRASPREKDLQGQNLIMESGSDSSSQRRVGSRPSLDLTVSTLEEPVLRVRSKHPNKRTDEGLLTSTAPHSITVKGIVR